MNMTQWHHSAAARKKAMPVLSFPGMQLIGATVDRLVRSGELQAECMKAISDRYDTLASVSLMDLSVEAEAFGSPVRFSDDEVPTVTSAIVKTDQDADQLKVPVVGAGRTGEYVKTIENAVKRITDRPVLAGMIGPFSLAGRLLDMTEIMISCMTNPNIVHSVMRKTTEFLIAYGKTLQAAGANGLIMAEPAAGLLSPKLNNDFSVYYVKQIIDAIDTDDFLVVYHNCGRTLPLLDGILSTGARVIHLGNAITLSEALAKIPQNVLVMGNVDPSSQFRIGTPESVREATLGVLNACHSYPNFIISSGCDIPPVSPLENIDAFFATVREFYR
ncbi:MAG: uroporphyrinogen decarboxylase family protein [Planctomycetaceae bacterium]|nr:uroporphyrinogen decarboxylase family protein [Planctomycetaceae bacterium]